MDMYEMTAGVDGISVLVINQASGFAGSCEPLETGPSVAVSAALHVTWHSHVRAQGVFAWLGEQADSLGL